MSSLLSFLPLNENERRCCISDELIRSKTAFHSFISPVLPYFVLSKVPCATGVNNYAGLVETADLLCDSRCCRTPITLLFSGRPPSSPLCPGPAGVRSSYASQHSQLGQDLRSAISPDRHIAPIYEDRTFQGPLYRSPSHNQQGTLYRSSSGWHHSICEHEFRS